MNFDVNRIIMESLTEKSEIVIEESVEASLRAAERSGKAFSSIFTGGSPEDEASAAKEYAAKAAEKLGEKNEPESIVAKHYLKQVGRTARVATDTQDIKDRAAYAALTAKKAVKTAGKSTEEAAGNVAGVGKKALKAVQEHPGITAGVAAALAAGLGALALRKRLKKAKKD